MDNQKWLAGALDMAGKLEAGPLRELKRLSSGGGQAFSAPDGMRDSVLAVIGEVAKIVRDGKTGMLAARPAVRRAATPIGLDRCERVAALGQKVQDFIDWIKLNSTGVSKGRVDALEWSKALLEACDGILFLCRTVRREMLPVMVVK